MSEPREFVLTDQHVALLRAANISWYEIEWGAPAIDGKRPYGNSDINGDLARLLNVDAFIDHEGEERWTPEQFEEMRRLHRETETALQVILAAGQFTPGRYVTSDAYSRDWRPV